LSGARSETSECDAVSMKFMRRSGAVLRVLVAVVLTCACSPAWPAESAPHKTTHRESKTATKPAHQTSEPCQNVAANKAAEEAAVGWDPVSCWDCESRDEMLGSFVLGVILTTPMCLVFLRLRTRRGEAEAFQKTLPF